MKVMNTTSVRTVLWDISPDKIDTLPASFVIQRALSYGSIFLIVEMIKKNGIDVVRTVFDSMKPTAMSRRRYNYISSYLLL